MTVIAIANQKGGSGKTTTALNFAAGLAEQGYRSLMIDFDSQANLTFYAGIENYDELEITVANTLSDIIGGKEERTPLPILSCGENLDLVPANTMLAGANLMLIQAMAREWVLKTAIEPLQAQYDFIIIDCAPSLGIDLVNALTAADRVLIATNPAIFSEKGTEQLIKTIFLTKRHLNKNLEIAGILFTRVDRRTNRAKQIISEMREAWKNDVNLFETEIPSAVSVEDSQSDGLPVFKYNAKAKPGIAYRQFVLEYLRDGGGANG